MKHSVKHIYSVSFLCMLCSGCTDANILGLRASLPVVTTLELRNSPKTAPLGELVGVGGVITACDIAKHTVVLDDLVECTNPIFTYPEALSGLMKGYSENIGAAAAVRGRLTRPTNSRYIYQLKPFGPCIVETDEVKHRLSSEKKYRPRFRFAKYYGWYAE